VDPEALGFRPEEASTLEKSFKTDCELVLDDFTFSMNGEESDPGMLGIPTDFEVSFGYLLECMDAYESVADGRPLALLRTFEEFEGWYVDPDGVEAREDTGEFDSLAVRFTWNEEEEEYDREVVEGEYTDEEGLAVLNEDLDLRGLLPEDEVEEGDSWEVSGAPLMAILVPGVDLTRLLDEEDTEDVPEEIVAAAERLVAEATATCTFDGLEEEDGRRLARITLEWTVADDLEFDPSTFGLDEIGIPMDDSSFEASFGIELEGVCLWDLEAGHFHSFEMEGLVEFSFDAAVTVGELDVDIEASVELSLDITRTASAALR
jgi:hypothetical protein